ncbi:hypothetical protein HanXRQr2_Chr04g0189111 [Helianthus annuus]|uniref:Uncharacterized protein n=1 Tax=Helianthus annuus TaxID=4232 RepID=A0A251V315_HELAN|nr:uncharacterized protein LOC110938060 isoform X2 [Helianthus annuus]KAF5812127.1 hypothetical protein HanXRQr2_Chr04g0189111 [Helianthus annuus]KAJ0598703.1 hypothetical protein HanHA89_Chr04g0168651 [Helianthus annuus]KAJ0762957.1 hypothetical protein HanOQP8_Chr04g0166941 [Helianthus annuus]
MASSGKFDLSSVSPDRPLYSSAQRGSYSAASLDRSSSFRENMENPILSSLPSMSRSNSTVTQVDVTNFFQCLRFDPKSMAAEHKFNRYGDFKRLASAVVGSPDESPSGLLKGKLRNSSPEDLKRLKAGLRESTIKARERVKVFSETLSVINKCFPSIPSRKRSRPDALPGDRSSGLLLNRAPMGAGVGKMGTQSHSLTNTFDFEQQKVEERGKNAIPNKRTRTSMVDQRAEVRPNTPARSSGLPNGNTPQSEDRSLHIVADGWEKTKMKKKRTGIKADNAPSPNSMSTKAINGYKEPKQGMHARHLSDSMSRLNDSHGLRPGAANGIIGGVKIDGPAQQASVGIRSSIPRPEQETTSLHHDKRDRSTSSEKERTNLRSVNNKSSFRDEFISGSPTSGTKLHGPARGPRSGSSVVPKSSTVVQRANASSDWDMGHVTHKNPGQFGSNNRKRTPATRSPSPPVAQWADRRPQKISRTARRTNLVPILSNSDEAPALDNSHNTSDVTGSESGPGFSKRFSASSPQQFKSKGDYLPSSTPSESEESGAAEIRSRDKGKKSYEVEDKGEPNVQKMSTLVPTVRKNKMVNGEEVGDGIRRQNRTGRGFGSSRGVTPPVEKIRHVGTAKQLRTARQSFDKSESKPGRPPTRKLSDRKAYTRQKQTAFNAAVDFPVGSEDGHEELLAAAKAVTNPNHALSSPFWRQMGPLFGFVSDLDMSYLKQQGSTHSSINTKTPVHQDIDSSGTLINGAESRSVEPMGPGEIPLSQRLLAALISEGDDELPFNGNNDHNFNVYGSAFEFDTDLESNTFKNRSLQNYELVGRGNLSGHRKNSTLGPPGHHIVSMPDSTAVTGFDHSYNGLLSDPAMTSGITWSDYQYANVPLNERLLMEIQSIGLYPELVPDSPNNGSEGISGEICRLEEKLHEQVSRKKRLLDNLLESTNEARELQEKEFEQLCIDKLTAMTYQKYMSCWGPHAPKSVGSKVSKQAALGFVSRTLDRCHEFESTGKSCFTEPVYKEMIRSGSLHLNGTQFDAATNNESGKINGKSIERVSGTQLSPSLNNHDMYSSDAFHFSEQTSGKDENIWSSRVKKRELYLDDVVAGTSSGFGTTILNTAKGKRSERDREGKGNGLSRNGGPKVGRPASGNAKGERKNKTKLKQKTTQLSASLNGPIGKISDQNRTFSSIPTSFDMKNNNVVKEEDEYKFLDNNTEEPLDFSHMEIPDVLGEQGEDIGSWLNIDDDILQDDDFMGLEIPMDDLSDLNMMV